MTTKPKLLLALVLTLLCGCAQRQELCNDNKPHQWGMWTNVGVNFDGYVIQEHTCKNCGYSTREAH